MFEQLKNLLPKEARKRGFSKEMDALTVINQYKKCCREIYGEDMLNQFHPRSYKNNTLYIDVENSALAQHFYMKQHLLLEKINIALNQNALSKILVQIKNGLDNDF